MSALERIRDEARKRPRKIALPEADEPRTLQAAVIATEERLARIFLVCADASKVRGTADHLGLNLRGIDLVDVPKAGKEHDRARRVYLERSRARGLSESEAADHVRAPLLFAAISVSLEPSTASWRGRTQPVRRPFAPRSSASARAKV